MSLGNESHMIGGPLFMEKFPVVSGIYLAIAGSASVVGIFGNFAILGAIACNKQLHHSRNIFIANLAIADLCVTGFADPFSIVGLVHGKPYFDERPILCEAVSTVCLAACITALFSIGGIAFNRYIHICHSDIYKRIFHFSTNLAFCCGFWIVGILLSLPPLLGWTDNIYDHKYLECFWSRTHKFSWTLFFSIGIVATPVVIISFSFIKIYLHVRASKRRIEEEHKGGISLRNDGNKNSSIKLARTLFIIFGVFVGCWSPFALLVVIDYKDKFPMEVHLFILLLAHMHSTLNSIVYALTNVHFKHGYKKLLFLVTCGKFASENESDLAMTNATNMADATK